jgi:NDP-mannose synthase
MHAVILAGGKGVRLRPYTTALPKPLVPLGDDDVIIDVILRQLAMQGFTSVTLAINHLGALIRAYVGNGSRWGLSVTYAHEQIPLGTFGPLVQIRDDLPEAFLVMNGDILTNLRFDRFLADHLTSGAPLTVATYPAENKVEFGVLDIEDEHICGFTEKPSMTYHVSMGVYAMSRCVLDGYEPGIPCGADRLILDLLRRRDYPASYSFTGLWRDIGRPGDYDEVNATFPELLEQLVPVLSDPEEGPQELPAPVRAERRAELLPAVGI